MNFLKNIQNKPEPVKKVVMWFGVFFVMAMIFVFWLMTFPSQIPSAEENNEVVNNLQKELPGVWQSLEGQISELKHLWQK